MSAIGFLFGFGCVWLIAGLWEMHTALAHAKQYKVSAITFAAWFWLAGAAVAFAIAFLLEAKP